MSAALQYFEENLPHRPYHTNDLAFGLRISGKGRALLARYIQQNQPHAQFWLVFDVDREGAAIARSLCEKLRADVNYSGLICKNPFHLEWL